MAFTFEKVVKHPKSAPKYIQFFLYKYIFFQIDSDCCLMPNEQFSAIITFWWDDDDNVHFVPNQHGKLHFYSASILKQQSTGTHVAPFEHIILNPCQPVFALTPWIAYQI